ncbi:uncharacterized protein LOC128965149 [Oppia nitens]|uniref:uncharacterized protein LOC128965149 n=1 Tax=Oppia nitens TaxID=1686743 RepID=UPI0023DC12AE|nr:uncharacterized protein LOC128965149 [Oppia nitens]
MSKIFVTVILMAILMVAMVWTNEHGDNTAAIDPVCTCNFYEGHFCGYRNLDTSPITARLLGNCEQQTVYYCPGGNVVAVLKSRCSDKCLSDGISGNDHCPFV